MNEPTARPIPHCTSETALTQPPRRKLMIKTFLICHFCTFPLCLNFINSDHEHCSCPCNLKNIVSSKMKCSHRRGHFQACIWLILRHYKLKISVKMQNVLGGPLPFSPIDVIYPKLPSSFLYFCFAVVLGLADGPAQICYAEKNPVYNPVSICNSNKILVLPNNTF